MHKFACSQRRRRQACERGGSRTLHAPSVASLLLFRIRCCSAAQATSEAAAKADWVSPAYYVGSSRPFASKSSARWRASSTIGKIALGTEMLIRGYVKQVDYITCIGYAVSGEEVPMELVEDHRLEEFLTRFQEHSPRSPVPDSPDANFCREGRFLINDPRVGLFQNQRMSYEIAMMMAVWTRRTLVLPGFFKFPHPEAWDGLQWVPVGRLFDWPMLKRCSSNVIDLGELIARCGSDLLDRHVTVPFSPLWLRSKVQAPWINGTRRSLHWSVSGGKSGAVRFRSRRIRRPWPIEMSEPLWYYLRAMMEAGVAEARVVRVHGVLAADMEMRGLSEQRPVCFAPSTQVIKTANRFLDRMRSEADGKAKILALHLRIFKQDTSKSGGFLLEESKEWFKKICNVEAPVSIAFTSTLLTLNWGNYWPTHTFAASNEHDRDVISNYVAGLPGVRFNPYSPVHYNDAVSSEECAAALESVLVDAVVCAHADRFIGNYCSTMSEYIRQLRGHLKKSPGSSAVLGGRGQQHLFEAWKDTDEYKALQAAGIIPKSPPVLSTSASS